MLPKQDEEIMEDQDNIAEMRGWPMQTDLENILILRHNGAKLLHVLSTRSVLKN